MTRANMSKTHEPTDSPPVVEGQEARLQRLLGALSFARVATFAWDVGVCRFAWEDGAKLCFTEHTGVVYDADVDFLLGRVAPEDRELVRAAVQSTARSSDPARTPCRSSLGSGESACHLELVTVASHDDVGELVRVVGAFIDVSQHRRIAHTLTEATERFRLALSTGKVGLFIAHLAKGENEADPVTATIFGRSQEELRVSSFEKFISEVDPRDRQHIIDTYQRAVSEGHNDRWVYRYRKPGGALVWVSSSMHVEYDDQGRPARFVNAATDFTEHKRAELRLHTQSEVSATLAKVDTLPHALAQVLDLLLASEELPCAAFWLLDEQANLLRCEALRFSDAEGHDPHAELHRAARAYTFTPGVGPIGSAFQPTRPSVAVINDDPFAALLTAYALVPVHIEPVQWEGRCIGVLAVFDRALREDPELGRLMHFAGEQLASFVRRQQAEQALRNLNVELEMRVVDRTRELQSAVKDLESFSYSVSHDLRAPLRAMNAFSQAVIADHGALLPDSGRQLLDSIRDGAVRMSELIDDLLDFSRLGRAPLRKLSFNMPQLVTECLKELAPTHAARDVRITLAELPNSDGDRSLLRQVWLNLLSNAIKYTGKCAVAEVSVQWDRVDGETIYSVKDNGAGFDMRYAHKLFGVFRRLHRAEDYEGTGVGLAIVHRVIERHGGRVWVDAVRDKGATFFFTLAPKPSRSQE